MATKELVELYFKKVKEKSDWQKLIDEAITFESPAPPAFGKEAYVTAASRFFQMVDTLVVKDLVVENENASARVEYSLMKNGKKFTCMVSELLKVRNDRLVSSAIMFDTLALKSFTAQN